MKEFKDRVSIIFKSNFDRKKTNNIISYISGINKSIESVDNYSTLNISCEIAQMKTNKIIKYKKGILENNQDGTEFLIFKN